MDAPPTTAKPRSRTRTSPGQDSIIHLASRVSSNLEEGDFKGAVRLACSDDTLADMSDATYCALQRKHPAPHPDSSIPPLPVQLSTMPVPEDMIV